MSNLSIVAHRVRDNFGLVKFAPTYFLNKIGADYICPYIVYFSLLSYLVRLLRAPLELHHL